MKNSQPLLVTMAALMVTVSIRADVLELKNGQVLNGKYVGGTSATLRFESDGATQIFQTSQIIALSFATPTPTSAPAPAAAPASPSAQPTKTVTLPAGTMLLVRVMDSVSSKNAPGANFTTKLEYNLVTDGIVAAPAGTIIYGKVQSSTQARRVAGRSTLDLRLAQMVIKGSPVSIATTGYKQASQASIAKAAKGAAAGATIGAIAGDAGKGAAIGATAGALKRGQTITITPGTLLEFTLTQPVSVTVAN